MTSPFQGEVKKKRLAPDVGNLDLDGPVVLEDAIIVLDRAAAGPLHTLR
jgi:hypothetical protein